MQTPEPTDNVEFLTLKCNEKKERRKKKRKNRRKRFIYIRI